MSREDYAVEATREGKAAYRDGSPCPYPDGCLEAWAWGIGWSTEQSYQGQKGLLAALHPPVRAKGEEAA